ncbi:thioredoxin domain-containing protein [Novosphingobium sp. Gsoil 351]|uniref:thioredoxin domain-containing protein n=1 Tax=Novosphingobium sp. Gsoil 351 TaxID=2675225 RepID=UPI0012B46AD2|nr:thioredoxin domain-containing protein [Novosphingobium sp. Gsoil 351]QGN54372.1 thioredoxin domain-containing protein [Novosphingobium sp. Gsoil 351]
MHFRAAVATLAALALGVSACGKSTDGAADAPAASSTPIAKIAPPAGKAWADTVSVTPEGGYLMGNPNAPIKLIEFGALSCSHCAEFAEKSFAKMRDDYVASGRVSFELRLFMLNALDIPAAMLATCGAPESVIPLSEQFWAWQPNMFTNLQTAGDAKLQAAGNLPPNQRFAAIAGLAGMDKFFAERGIATDQAAACLADVKKATTLSNQTQAANEKYQVSGTPTFYLNGKNLNTATWETLEPMLQTAGAR